MDRLRNSPRPGSTSGTRWSSRDTAPTAVVTRHDGGRRRGVGPAGLGGSGAGESAEHQRTENGDCVYTGRLHHFPQKPNQERSKGFGRRFPAAPLLPRFQNDGRPCRNPHTEPFTKFPGIKAGGERNTHVVRNSNRPGPATRVARGPSSRPPEGTAETSAARSRGVGSPTGCAGPVLHPFRVRESPPSPSHPMLGHRVRRLAVSEQSKVTCSLASGYSIRTPSTFDASTSPGSRAIASAAALRVRTAR